MSDIAFVDWVPERTSPWPVGKPVSNELVSDFECLKLCAEEPTNSTVIEMAGLRIAEANHPLRQPRYAHNLVGRK